MRQDRQIAWGKEGVGISGGERVVTFKEQQAATAKDGSIPTEQPRSAGASAPTGTLRTRTSRPFVSVSPVEHLVLTRNATS